MNKQDAVTRRTMLVTLSGIAVMHRGIQTIAASPAPKPSKRITRRMSDVEKKYASLLPLWQEERKQFITSSNTRDYWQGTHGQSIIALGPAIIPYLIKELRKGDSFFNVPLEVITDIDLSNGNNNLSEQDIAKLWLKWWANAIG